MLMNLWLLQEVNTKWQSIWVRKCISAKRCLTAQIRSSQELALTVLICRPLVDVSIPPLSSQKHQDRHRTPQSQETEHRHILPWDQPQWQSPLGVSLKPGANHHLTTINKQCLQPCTNHQKLILASRVKATLLITTTHTCPWVTTALVPLTPVKQLNVIPVAGDSPSELRGFPWGDRAGRWGAGGVWGMKMLTETLGHVHGLPLNPGKQTFSLEDARWKFVKLHYSRLFRGSREGYHPWRSWKLRKFLLGNLSHDSRTKVPRYCLLSFLAPGPRNPPGSFTAADFSSCAFCPSFLRSLFIGNCWIVFSCFFWPSLEWRVFNSHLGLPQMLQINK